MSAPLVLTGATLLDGAGAPPVAGRAVVVEGARITAVVPEAQAPAARRLRLDGLTLLPGLVNCHVHLCLGGEADPAAAMRQEPYAVTVIRAVLRARQTVEAGVTAVRDLGGRDYAELAVRDAIRAGLIPGPRVLAAGRGVCMTGGHGWQMIGREADGPDEVRRAVREQLKAGFAVEKSLAILERHRESFRLALRHGVTVAAGTDAGTPLNPHGSLGPELALMVDAGMPEAEVIRSATSVAARVLGLAEETGRIAPGLAADLLAVAGDPLARIGALDEVRLVVAAGRVVVDRLGRGSGSG